MTEKKVKINFKQVSFSLYVDIDEKEIACFKELTRLVKNL